MLIPHTHTTESDGMVSPESLVDIAARHASELKTKIFLAITDHDTINGVEKAQKRAQKYKGSLEIICGEEVTAGIPIYQKHIVALNIQKPIQHSMSIFETVEEIKKQNGIVIIPHPHVFGIPIASLTFNEISLLIQKNLLFDGIEITSISKKREAKIETAIDKLNVKVNKIGSPDSHYGADDLFSAFTILKGKTKADLLNAFKVGTLKPVQGIRKFPKFSTWLNQKVLALGILGVRRYLLGNLR